MDKPWFKDRLTALGRTQADLARHLGLDASAVSRLLKGERQMKGAEAVQIANFLRCPVEDVLRAIGGAAAARPVAVDDPFVADPQPVPASGELPRNLPVHGAAVGGHDGSFEWNGQVQEYIERPPQLTGVRNAFAVWVTGESMHPMFQPGWVLHVNPNRPLTPGCGVVVQIRPSDDFGHPLCYIKEFVRRTASKLVLRQYNPSIEIEWPLDEVVAAHRVVGVADM
ncbi:MAG: helix-turn-helix transcriptional regulator [Alphaproteobacteria bacterium]|nr:helix-turn-helix transcriptional regulator [Alphaproteobacteria bacterium]